MIRKMVSMFLVVAVTALFVGPISGCADDVKKVETLEQTHVSEPEMVSPGEPVVE